jgi:hypothetical protein
MERQASKNHNNWVITVESRYEQHQEIILAAIAKRAFQLFEQRGCAHGFALEDWIAAEKELLQNDFNGNTSQFDLFIESPGDPEVTTILSLTTHSLVVFRSHTQPVSKNDNRPDVLSVHVLPEEIDPAQADVKAVDGLLHVNLPKKNSKGWRQKTGDASVPTKGERGEGRGDGRGRRGGHG